MQGIQGPAVDAELARQFSFDTQTFEDIKRAGRRSRSNSVTSIRSNYSLRRQSRGNSQQIHVDLKDIEAEVDEEGKKLRKMQLGPRRGSFVEALGQDSVSAFLNTFDKVEDEEDLPFFSYENLMQVFVLPISPDSYEILL